MGLNRNLGFCLNYLRSWLFLIVICLDGFDNASDISVKYLMAPRPLTRLSSAKFVFEVYAGGRGSIFKNSSINCKLDDQISTDCESGNVSYANLVDGNHSFVVCINSSGEADCCTYTWIVDTIPPTAHVIASSSFTDKANVSVFITFSEPCRGGDGFSCSSSNSCSLLVYGAGLVIPSTFNILQPNLKFSLLVGFSSGTQYGRVVLVMNKHVCTDDAGNVFTRTANSSFLVHFDRRSVFLNLRTHVPEKLLELLGERRMVQATNEEDKLKVYLYFTEPVLNSSAEILYCLHTSQGFLSPKSLNSHGSRRFGFEVKNLTSIAIVTVSLDSDSVISRKGTSVSPVAPLTFLYDSQRPVPMLSTSSNFKTREFKIPLLIKFTKPVFGFNSSHISLSGGHLKSFSKVSTTAFVAEILADDDLSISVPENITTDIAGNMNLASNILHVRHYSVPAISSALSILVTTSIVGTSFTAGILAVSTASLQSLGTYSASYTFLPSDPSRNLFRTICHVQVFALSRWLSVDLPVQYYEFVRSLRWIIPYFDLPWETVHPHPITLGFSSRDSKILRSMQNKALPLSPLEYTLLFESTKPEADVIMDQQASKGWKDFSRIMFWLSVISGGFILLHALLLLILKFKVKISKKQSYYGALALPRFEIFLLILALPSLSEASAALIKVGGPWKIVVGGLVMGAVSFLMLALFFFISIGITFGKLLLYKEVHQENLKFHWYQDILRITLGPGRRGQWTWKKSSNSIHRLLAFGPLFEDFRGPPKYMLSQISKPREEQIIASEDETEDAEAPFIQKLFGTLRIYYTLLESAKRICLGIMIDTRSNASETPTLVLLSLTAFQMFFLLLKKPFIRKSVQLLEAISVATELGIFTTFLILLKKDFSDESAVGIFMLLVFFVGFLAQMVNVVYGLYRQIKQLDSAGDSFVSGLKIVWIGIVLLIGAKKVTGLGERGEKRESENLVSGRTEKPMVKEASGERSGNSWVSSADGAKPKANALYRDLEAIFASK